MALECRTADKITQKLIAPLNHLVTTQCVTAERAMCKYLGASCQVPVAAYAEKIHNQIHLQGLVASPDGLQVIRAAHKGIGTAAEKIGELVAKTLLQLGADEILKNYAG